MSELSGLRGASKDDPLLELDARGRVSIIKLAGRHRRFLATVQEGGQILLTPVTIFPADQVPEVLRHVDTTDPS